MTCPNCGAENPEGSAFCLHCGLGLKDQPNPYIPMAQRGPPSPAQAQPLPYGYPFAQPGPNNYPPVDLKDVGIAMIIGIFVPGFGHVYCNKVLLGLAIFTTFIIVLLAALFFGALSFGITSLFFGPLLITIVVLELLSVKGIAEEYNRVVRMTGRPPE